MSLFFWRYTANIKIRVMGSFLFCVAVRNPLNRTSYLVACDLNSCTTVYPVLLPMFEFLLCFFSVGTKKKCFIIIIFFLPVLGMMTSARLSCHYVAFLWYLLSCILFLLLFCSSFLPTCAYISQLNILFCFIVFNRSRVIFQLSIHRFHVSYTEGRYHFIPSFGKIFEKKKSKL